MLKEVFLNSRIRYFTALTLQRPHGFIAGAKRKPSETRLHQVRYLNLFTLMIYLDTKCLRQVSGKRNGRVLYQPNHHRTRCVISVLHVYNLIICISLVCYAEGPNWCNTFESILKLVFILNSRKKIFVNNYSLKITFKELKFCLLFIFFKDPSHQRSYQRLDLLFHLRFVECEEYIVSYFS